MKDRLMGWVKYPQSIGMVALELRFRRSPNLFSEDYTLYDIHTVILPSMQMLEAPLVGYRDGVIYFLNKGELRLGMDIEVEEIEGYYWAKLIGSDDWILPLKAIPDNIR